MLDKSALISSIEVVNEAPLIITADVMIVMTVRVILVSICWLRAGSGLRYGTRASR
jgi:hypothetical protein